MYKYKSRFSKVRQSERWKQEGGQGKSNRISLALGSSYMAEFMESETHKVSTEEVIFSSTGGSPTKTKQKKFKKEKKKTGFHSLLVHFICSDKENLFCRGTPLGNPVWVPKSLLNFQGLSSILCMCSIHTIYIIVLCTCSFQGGEIVQIQNSDLVELYT